MSACASSSSEAARLKYSQELAAYTLRQFFEAHVSLDQQKGAVDKLPASHQRNFDKLARSAAQLSSGYARGSSKYADDDKPSRRPVAAA